MKKHALLASALALALALGIGAVAATASAADKPADTKPAAAAEAKPAADKPAAAEAKPAAPEHANIDWAKMSKQERGKYMKAKVLPEMKTAFQAFDKSKYKAFSCATCHGEKGKEHAFKMPNPDLPKLPQPTDRAGFMAVQEKKPEMVKFMGGTVKPKMAALLNLPEWSPSNTTGFGCYQCHTAQEAAKEK